MSTRAHNGTRVAVGQSALRDTLAPNLPAPMVRSFVVSGARRTVETAYGSDEYYPRQYVTDGSPFGNLCFAFRHEPLDLRIVHAALKAIGAADIENWVREEPTGAFSRRAWFLYETLTGDTLSLDAAKSGNYVDALDPKRHYVADPLNSSRHRVRNNLLGGPNLCPTVRRTRRLEEMSNAALAAEAQAVTTAYSPDILARAARYLYATETRSSFAIEGDTPSRSREERFLVALRDAPHFHPADKEALVRLQTIIVDPRYAADDWRTFQNYVGETTRRFGEYIHYICPRPQDVPALMQGWINLTERVRVSSLDPVVAAAVTSFAFVFIHPFEDGNGRIHRFLVHSMLAARGFSPPGIIFPVSAAILRQMNLYEQALQVFSQSIQPAIEWDFIADNAIAVHNETRDLYRFFDATPQAEYLFAQVAETIRVDFKAEADYIEVLDAAIAAMRTIVDMPDRRASLLIRFCLQNGGALSNNKRKQFEELSEDEINRIEVAIQEAMRTNAFGSL